MKIICAWCRREGKSGILGEKSPLTDQGETHSICWEHMEWLRTQREAGHTSDNENFHKTVKLTG